MHIPACYGPLSPGLFIRGRQLRFAAKPTATAIARDNSATAVAVHLAADRSRGLGANNPGSPRACDASFARAKEFFARHFPEERYEAAVCHSWLLDDQLAAYLPADANILQFRRRSRPAYRPDDDDRAILRSVFGRIGPALDALPRRTTPERAIIDHLRAGRHWHGGVSWLRL